MTQKKMDYRDQLYIAFDGGGSKTDIVLLEQSGKVLNRVIGKSSNVNEIGFDKVRQRLITLLDKLLDDYGGRHATYMGVYAGMSGGGLGTHREAFYALIRELLPHTRHISNGGDGMNALVAGLGTEDGMVVIAGTGSIVYVQSNRTIHQIGGWGSLLGDEGSGYDIGRCVINAALKAMDGRGSATLLFDRVEEKLNAKLADAIPSIYQQGKKYIAAFAPMAFQAAAEGDVVAIQIVEQAAYELAMMMKAGSKHLVAPPWKVVLAGGVWKAGEALLPNIHKQLDDQYELRLLDLPPVYGAAILAVWQTEEQVDLDTFERAFCESLNATNTGG